MISIVLPVYNIEKYVTKCLESIVAQDYKDYELIIVNDGSTDNSRTVVEDFLKDKECSYKLINKENGGLSSARNEGLRQSSGEYVVFVDADDVIAEDFLSCLIGAMEKDSDFTFANFAFINEQKMVTDSNDRKEFFDKDRLLLTFLRRTINFVVPSMLFRRSFLIENNLFFNENTRFSEDQPFIWNVIFSSNKSVYLYKKLYGYFQRDTSIMHASSSAKISKGHEEYKMFVNDLLNRYPENEEIIRYILPRWQIGALYSSAKMLNKEAFNQLYNDMEGKTLFKRILGIKEIKAYLLSFVCSMSKDLLYAICRNNTL